MHLLRRALGLSFGASLLVLPAFAQQPSGSAPSSSMPAMPEPADSQDGTLATSSPADRSMMAGMTKKN